MRWLRSGPMVAPHELTFAQALDVEEIGDDCFEGHYADWSGIPRVFGGLVLGQVVAAAWATVEPDRDVHSLHGYFLRPAVPGDRPRLEVERVRDGRSYSNRQVSVRVDGKETARFSLSFCVPEEGRDYQPSMPDAPDPRTLPSEISTHPFEIIELGCSEADPGGFYEWTRRIWFRCVAKRGQAPEFDAAALAYISDHTGMALRPGEGEYEEASGDASLDHSLWFHRPFDPTSWHLYDLSCASISSKRSAVQGRIFAEDGRLVATAMQELLVRPLGGERPESKPTGRWTPE
jgi:acyl-CoA thioesterase II